MSSISVSLHYRRADGSDLNESQLVEAANAFAQVMQPRMLVRLEVHCDAQENLFSVGAKKQNGKQISDDEVKQIADYIDGIMNSFNLVEAAAVIPNMPESETIH